MIFPRNKNIYTKLFFSMLINIREFSRETSKGCQKWNNWHNCLVNSIAICQLGFVIVMSFVVFLPDFSIRQSSGITYKNISAQTADTSSHLVCWIVCRPTSVIINTFNRYHNHNVSSFGFFSSSFITVILYWFRQNEITNNYRLTTIFNHFRYHGPLKMRQQWLQWALKQCSFAYMRGNW